MFTVKKQEVKNLFNGVVKKVNYVILGDEGDLHGTVDTEDHAEIIAYGLNHGFTESFMGGFSDEIVEQIKKQMK